MPTKPETCAPRENPTRWVLLLMVCPVSELSLLIRAATWGQALDNLIEHDKMSVHESFLSVKALLGASNKEKKLLGA